MKEFNKARPAGNSGMYPLLLASAKANCNGQLIESHRENDIK